MNVFVEMLEGNNPPEFEKEAIEGMNIIDFYESINYKPKVIKYSVYVFPELNGILKPLSPVYHDTSDSYEVNYEIVRDGAETSENYF